MERYYQVIIKAPININPGDKVYKFMPGESHSLPEHLGKEIFREGSVYTDYFSLIDIVPPLDVVIKSKANNVFKASNAPALNTLSNVVPLAPISLSEEVEVKEDQEEPKKDILTSTKRSK